MALSAIYKGEVCTLKLDLEESVFNNLEQGAFAAESDGGVVPHRLLYVKSTEKSRPVGGDTERTRHILYLTVDARPSLPRPGDRKDPNARRKLGDFEDWEGYEIATPSNVVDCMLSIDLGNTRTVALLVDGLGESAPSVYELPIACKQRKSESPLKGAFKSLVSLTNADSRPDGEFCDNEGRLSFVRLGRFAEWNNYQFRGREGAGRYTLSSPKRYFWDADPSSRDWVASRMPVDAEQPKVEHLNGIIAAELGMDCGIDMNRLPPAAMLGAMLAELYEQGCYYVSSAEFKKKSCDSRCRRISRIHVTYPSTLLPRELELYRERLQNGLRAYLRNFPETEVELTSDIDEATSVLSLFAYNEIRRNPSAFFWLQSIGRRSPIGREARIAVIDVGGGTSDLSISAVSASEETAGVDPYSATIDLFCRDGVNTAGDAFIFAFIENCVAKAGFKAVAQKLEHEFGTKDADLRANYHSSEMRPHVRSLTKTFWFDLALSLAIKLDELLRRYPNDDIRDDDLSVFRHKFSNDDATDWCRIAKLKANDVEKVKDLEIEIAITQEIVSAYRATAEKTFRSIAHSFANLIAAYDVDILVLSGKTMEFTAVQNVFKRRIALPSSAIRSMKDYRVSDWCGKFFNGAKSITDSKISTALGGALYALRNEASVNLSFTNNVVNTDFKWGIVPDGQHVAFTRPIFGDGELQKDIPMTSPRRLFARKTPYGKTAILSYELRIKPEALEKHGGIGDGVSVRLESDPLNNALRVVSATGTFRGDATELHPEDVECRVCTMDGEFMMDRIVEIA